MSELQVVWLALDNERAVLGKRLKRRGWLGGSLADASLESTGHHRLEHRRGCGIYVPWQRGCD